ncbi:MAG: 3-hydroxyacyl-CoA dehydrogenase family protein [Halobacteriales archaeon]
MSIDRSAVIGAGTMGHGIALAYAMGGQEVRLYDVDPDALADARDLIADATATFVEAGHLSAAEADAARDRIAYHEEFGAAVAGVDLVTEAAPEELAIKRETFSRLDGAAPGDAILASNTSGLPITDLAEGVSDPGRVMGTHWFNPPHIVPLVEVVHGDRTDQDAVDRVYDELEAVGKTPVEVTEDIPGYIGNRIQLAMAYEAFSLLERGVADAEAIDRVVKAGFGFRLPVLGILEKADHSGLEVHHAVEEYLMPELDRGTEPSAVIADLVGAGHYGLKTGRGVYDWDRPPEEVYAERDRDLLALLSAYEATSR